MAQVGNLAGYQTLAREFRRRRFRATACDAFVATNMRRLDGTEKYPLKVDEAIARNKGQSLRDFVGKEVKFAAAGPKSERLTVVIKIPAGLTVPEVGNADEVRVTFVCARGHMRQGNEAKSIELP